MKSIKKWEDLSTEQCKKLDRQNVIVLPTGAIESHGNHLAVGVDIEIAHFFSKIIVKKYNAILFPSISLGPCETLLNFPGTITISEDTYFHYLIDIISSLTHHSFNNICFINGHGGNTAVLQKVIKEVKKTANNSNIHFLNWFDSPYIEQLKKKDPTYRGDHGDRLETELMMLAKPESVYMIGAIDDLPHWPLNVDKLTDYSKIMTNSVEGYPSFADVRNAKIHFTQIKEYLLKSFQKYYE